MRIRCCLLALLFLITRVAIAQQPVQTADEILQPAYKAAAAQNKKVIVIFHASWCGWCHRMDTAMNDKTVKSYFDDHYITVHLTVLEADTQKHPNTPGAMELLKKYKGDTQGIPFWLILDKDGKWLADSRIKPLDAGPETDGDNTGCPANEKEVNYFISVLKKTSGLTDVALEKIRVRFRQNEH